jgi:hypothetical protein
MGRMIISLVALEIKQVLFSGGKKNRTANLKKE